MSARATDPPRGRGRARGGARGLALVGYRGTGKSTVGRLLARRLGRPFIDADVALEARFGRTIGSIFDELGEPVFRDWEEAMLAELTEDQDRLIATGGGAVLRESNRRRLRDFGTVVWLSASPRVIADRLGADPSAVAGRPALTPAGTLGEVAAVLAAREPLYREIADLEISTEGRTPEEVAEAVLDALAMADG
jgi:shikimate kinase